MTFEYSGAGIPDIGVYRENCSAVSREWLKKTPASVDL